MNNKTSNLSEIFKSRRLYISDANLTNKYIHYIKPINETEEKKYSIKGNEKDLIFNVSYFPKRKAQYNFKDYAKLCIQGKSLFNYKKLKLDEQPLISVILPTFNKKSNIIKSLRSIQNQSLKNIEIIIVDDCSTDNTSKYLNKLFKNDPRIRIFTHLKNMGVWRSRIDGFLYSNGKYIIHFDPDDLYEDNYVLEDAYNIVNKYNIDSIKMTARFIYNYSNLNNNTDAVIIKDNYTKIAYHPDIQNYNYYYFYYLGWIWNRLTRKSIFSKSLYLLSDKLLNVYKNYCEDQWWNKLVNTISYSYLVVKRYGYLYFKNGKGEGDFKSKTSSQRDKMGHEFIYFLYFDLELLPKNNNKKDIINILRKFSMKNNIVNLSFFKTKFYILDDLLKKLIKDRFISKEDKKFLKQLLIKSQKKQHKNN